MKRYITLSEYYDKLPNDKRFAIFIILIIFPCFFIGVGATIYQLWPPPEIFREINPWFNKTLANYLIGIGVTWLGAMFAFRLSGKKRK